MKPNKAAAKREKLDQLFTLLRQERPYTVAWSGIMTCIDILSGRTAHAAHRARLTATQVRHEGLLDRSWRGFEKV